MFTVQHAWPYAEKVMEIELGYVGKIDEFNKRQAEFLRDRAARLTALAAEESDADLKKAMEAEAKECTDKAEQLNPTKKDPDPSEPGEDQGDKGEG